FSIVPPGQADYLLAYVLDKADKEQQVAYVHPAYNPMMNPGPLTPQTDAQMSGAYQSTGVRQWNELQAAPLPDRVVTYHFTSKYIRLLLYTNPKTHDGNFQLVWQGNIDVNHGTSAAQEQALLKTLLGYFGRQQNGRVTPGPQE
ncbi:MAG TPA: hypothetical protein VFF11_04260, partial [Candidatus Binatia bacterium]|nr:hypothetical protein [Candidatus Binatia bacterium]